MIIIQVITPAAATRWTPTNATTVAPPPSWWRPRWGGTRWCARSWRASVANAGKRPGLQWKNGENHGKKVMGKKRKLWKPLEKWWKKGENGENHGKSDGRNVKMVNTMGKVMEKRWEWWNTWETKTWTCWDLYIFNYQQFGIDKMWKKW